MRISWPRTKRHFSQIRKAHALRMLFVFFCLSLLLPDSRLQHPRVRFISKPLKISTSKTNPPRLAFEEALAIRRAPAVAEGETQRPVSLNEVIGQGKLRSAVLALYYRQVQLGPMVLGRQEAMAPILRDSINGQRLGTSSIKLSEVLNEPDVIERRFEPNVQPRTPTSDELTYAQNRQTEEQWFEDLNPRQRRILEASGLRSADLNGPIAPSLAESLAQKVEEELARLQAGGTVIGPSSVTDNRVAVEVPRAVQVRTDDEPNAGKKNHRVSGHLFLGALTPFLPDHTIEVAWMRENQNRKTGRFSVTDSHFTIDVEELSGAVKLEMFDKAGTLVASGGVRLSPDLSAQALTQLQVKLRPVGQVASNFTDFYKQPTDLFNLDNKKVWSFGKNPIRTKASFDSESVFEADPQGLLYIDGIAGGSSSFAMTESDDHYPTLHMITAGQKEALPLIPKKTAQAMFEIIEQQLGYTSAQKNGAIVMGQVTASGRALSGAQVEIEGHPEAQPVYLNEVLIPDPQLKATTSSGYFVFIHLPQGFYSLRAMRGPQFIGYGNVVNEAHSAAFIEIEEPVRYAPFDIRTYDAFTGEGQNAELAFQSLNQTLKINGYGQIEHPIVSRYSLVEVEPTSESHLPAIYPYPGDQEFVHLPLIPRAWMDDIIAKAKVNLTPSAGAILGFSEKGGYDISLPHLPEDTSAQVIYFDVQGHQVPAAVDHGGFILVNMPPSAQTVVLKNALGGVVSRVMNADPDRLTVARFAF